MSALPPLPVLNVANTNATPASTIATTSAMVDDVTPDAVARHEHVVNAKRLKTVLAIGLATWLAIGIPGDWLLAATLSGCDLMSLLRVRLAAAIIMGLGLWSVYDDHDGATRPSPRWLHIIEIVTFATAAAATGMFVLLGAGLSSPVTAQLSVILLAQSTAFPRPWHKGARALLTTLLAFVVVVALGIWFDPRLQAQSQDALLGHMFATGLWSALGSMGILVVGGHAAWGLRRRAFTARHIGRYQLKRKIGKGGMGEVWVAWHAGLKRDVALKVLRASRHDKNAQRFLHAIEQTSRLSHPNTVRVLDRGAADGDHWYFAMELVEGKTLRALVDDEGPLPPARAKHIVLQIGRALAEAHSLGVVHRDLKPENVLVSSVGREHDLAKVCDFGLARSVSFSFAAPEQFVGDADAQSDVWGLGGLLLYATTGRHPRDPGRIDDVPAEVRSVVARCLTPNRCERYVDAGEFVRALATI